MRGREARSSGIAWARMAFLTFRTTSCPPTSNTLSGWLGSKTVRVERTFINGTEPDFRGAA